MDLKKNFTILLLLAIACLSVTNAGNFEDRKRTVHRMIVELEAKNLVSAFHVANETCWYDYAPNFANWLVMIGYLALGDFQHFIAMETVDGSYAIGVYSDEPPTKDPATQRWNVDSWRVPTFMRPSKPKDDFTVGPYYGAFVYDRTGRPTLALMQWSENYVHAMIYTRGAWKWVPRDNVENIFNKNDPLSLDADTPTFKRCGGRKTRTIIDLAS